MTASALAVEGTGTAVGNLGSWGTASTEDIGTVMNKGFKDNPN